MTTAPILLTNRHKVTEFRCGIESLDDWLKKRTLKNQTGGASRTFVICKRNLVVGYYALASGSIERLSAAKSIARNMPEPIPVMVLARLAVDIKIRGQGLGAALLKDALLRTLTVAQNVGIRAVLVHAISEGAKEFYQAYGFHASPIDSMTLMLPIHHIGLWGR